MTAAAPATAASGELSPECADWVRRVVDAAPPLTDEQRTRLAELLRPARTAVLDGQLTAAAATARSAAREGAP